MYPNELCNALHLLQKALKTDHIFIKRISSSIIKGRIVFYTDDEDMYYIADCVNAQVEIRHRDTWRHPEHIVIITAGDL